MTTLTAFLLFVAAFAAAPQTETQSVIPPAVELGRVAWTRDLDAALGAEPFKPVLLLFQEVPG